MMLPILLGGGGKKADIAESVDFDGTNDYLSRSTDFVGNVDSKTFTFSCWVYKDVGNFKLLVYPDSPYSINIGVGSTNNFSCIATNGSGATILSVSLPDNIFPMNTFTHVVMSVDLGNVSNRYVAVNGDIVAAAWAIYIDDVIDFTLPVFNVGGLYNSAKGKGRLAHLFLDYQYRDLSIEANRRIFSVPL